MTADPLQARQFRFSALLAHNARQWRRSINEDLKPLGLTEATWLPLVHLGRSKSAMLQKDLADSLALDRSSVVRLLDALEESGHVARGAVEDRRAKSVSLTDLGRQTMRQVEVVIRKARQRYLQGISEADLDVAVRVLQQVADALDTTAAEAAA